MTQDNPYEDLEYLEESGDESNFSEDEGGCSFTTSL